MKALNLHGVGDLRFEDVPLPERKRGEVMLRVRAVGICGSDIPRVFEKGTYHFPTIIGHEFAGEIVEADNQSLVGKGASVFPLLPCGKCLACQTGHYAQCKAYSYYGSRQDGAMAEYLAVKEANLCLLPDGVSYEAAAMNEPAAVALHAFRKSRAALGDTMVIYGIGAIAFLLAWWAKAAGVSNIILAGRSQAKVQMAEQLGFAAVNVREVDLGEYVRGLTGGEGADVCIEGTGCSDGAEACLDVAKRFGNVVLMGNPAGNVNISQNGYWQILRKELQLIGTWNSSFSRQENDWQQSLQAMQSGILQPEKLITHRFSLSEYKKAFDLMHEKQEPYLKVMFVL